MKISFVGDIYLPDKYQIDFAIENVICNFEFPLSTKGEPAKNKVNLGVNISFLLETFKNKPLAVNLANNHIMDYGEEGFLETITYLEKENIKYFGAGNYANNFNNPCNVELGERKISIFGYSCQTTHPVFGNDQKNGSAKIDVDKIISDIKSQKTKTDLIVVQLHWGMEEIPFPTFDDKVIAHQLIDNGADVIIGHHSHVIQSFEQYKGKYIYYGLGNFIFPSLDTPSYYDGEIFKRRYIKIQNKNNKKSLVVECNVETNMAIEYITEFDGAVVRKLTRNAVSNFIPKTQAEFLKRLKIYKKYMMIKRFLANPKIPDISHLRRFFGFK